MVVHNSSLVLKSSIYYSRMDWVLTTTLRAFLMVSDDLEDLSLTVIGMLPISMGTKGQRAVHELKACTVWVLMDQLPTWALEQDSSVPNSPTFTCKAQIKETIKCLFTKKIRWMANVWRHIQNNKMFTTFTSNSEKIGKYFRRFQNEMQTLYLYYIGIHFIHFPIGNSVKA